MLKFAKLLQHFDAEKMKAEVALLEATPWIQHYNKRDYEGGWTILPLRSLQGNPENIYAVPGLAENSGRYADTPLLQACPYLQSVLSFLPCEKTSVRLMKLEAGSLIREHRDTSLNFEGGEARLHIPIITNPQVHFFLDKECLSLQEGECWYLNLSLRHSVKNNSHSHRVHLVIDCQVNDWLRKQLTDEAMFHKYIEAEEAIKHDSDSKQKIIAELRRMNTPVALELADKLANEPV